MSTLATERYLLGEMTEPEREAFEAHYFECAECADDVRAGATMKEGVRLGLLEAPSVRPFVRAPRTASRWLRSPAIPWAIAACLAVVVSVTFVTSRLPQRRVFTAFPSALALTPITLRTAARGEESVVIVGPDDPVVTLAVDVPIAASSGTLVYVLRIEGGREIASGHVPAPEPGLPLLLLVPARLLTPSTRHILTLHDSVNAGLTAGDYHFTVVAR
ncbi:MAG: zf-HC2 domain-containing protein [Betaproteobacteria bacterium]